MSVSDIRTLEVALGERSYHIDIGSGLLAQAGQKIKEQTGALKCVVVTDENVAPLYLDTLKQSLNKHDLFAGSIILPAGEATKSYHNFIDVSEKLLAMGIERNDLVIALGGGVIGDLTGFAASALRRGVRFVQIPTTVLAQVDSSVGGKTGINSPHGKNLVGAFHQPSLVLIDTDVLRTLDRRQFAAGYAEIVKYGLIDQPDFYEWLEQNWKDVFDLNPDAVVKVIETSCQAKANIVAQDEKEGGVRALLNLGHTFGHALEGWAQYDGRLLHGEGVSIGMVMAFEFSEKSGFCPEGRAKRIAGHFKAVDMPASIADIEGNERPSAEELLTLMKQDKKVAAGKMTFILARDIGQSFITSDISEVALQDYLVQKCANL